MMNSQAAKASPRCADDTATSTICSCGSKGPTRWITSAPDNGQRARACSTMASMDFSVMPG
ncbi:hypothetical protein D3C87_2181250 [compost metagenome]